MGSRRRSRGHVHFQRREAEVVALSRSRLKCQNDQESSRGARALTDKMGRIWVYNTFLSPLSRFLGWGRAFGALRIRPSGRQSKVRPRTFPRKLQGLPLTSFLIGLSTFYFRSDIFWLCSVKIAPRPRLVADQPVAGVAWRHATPPSVALTHLVWHCLAWRHTTAPSVALAAGMPCHSQTCHSWGVGTAESSTTRSCRYGIC